MEKRFTKNKMLLKWLKILNILKESIPGICSVCGVIVIWEVSVRFFEIPSYILPSPSDSIKALIQYWDYIKINLFTTLYEIGVGFGATVVISIPIATMISYSRIFEKTV